MSIQANVRAHQYTSGGPTGCLLPWYFNTVVPGSSNTIQCSWIGLVWLPMQSKSKIAESIYVKPN